jgi:hypothetical protein
MEEHYSMADPSFMLMLIENPGREYIVGMSLRVFDSRNQQGGSGKK